ncbi:sulfatase [Bacteroidota bacterium]
MNISVRKIGLYTASVGFLVSSCQNKNVEPPNIIMICVDDLGWPDVAYNGSPWKTPNIDNLASRGMIFNQAYAAAAVSSPTRASIMTGRVPARLGITDWMRNGFQGIEISENMKNPSGYLTRPNWKLSCPENALWMESDEITIPELLKKAGYTSAHIGKWHLGPAPWFPEKQGFDINIGGKDFGSPPSYFDPYIRGNASIESMPPREEGEYLTDREADEAVRFIKENKNQLFYLNLWHYGVHRPLQAKDNKISELKKEIDARYKEEYVYAAMVKSVDDAVGKIIEALEELNLTDNTMIVFFSDNGGSQLSYQGACDPLRMGKGYPYEGGIRVPMIISWPGVVKQGTECNEPVSSIDFLPTFCAAAGVNIPTDRAIDGLDLGGLLRQKDKLPRTDLFWHFPHYWWGDRVKPFSIIRSGDYKLIKLWEDEVYELYNIKNDFRETTNIVENMPDKVNELKNKLDNWLLDTNAKLPFVNKDFKKIDN